MFYPALGYGSAAAAYLLLAAMLTVSRRTEGRGQWLLAAVLGSFVWASLIIASMAVLRVAPTGISQSADALRFLVWILCLASAFPSETGRRATRVVLTTGTIALFVIVVATALVWELPQGPPIALLGLSVMGCVALEQLYRNAPRETKPALAMFVWALATIFAFDLLVFCDAVLFGAVNPGLWSARGFLAAVAVPFFVLSAKRHPDWMESLFISRKVVFYSATFTGVGLYLIAMAVVGILIGQQDGRWASVAQLVFFALAVTVLAIMLSSTKVRTSTRVFISKNFFRYQYEYRDEWLRLIRTLSSADGGLSPDKRAIKALADIIESPAGQMWLDNDRRSLYEPFAAWQADFPRLSYGADSPLVKFLQARRWVMDTYEYARHPERYEHACLGEPMLPENSIIVPLIHQDRVMGIVRLVRAGGLRPLNFEDHDLLKTAGQQVAAFLAHDLATEKLSEVRQFEAYDRLSTFIVHDIKNLLAQQTLLVENARKYQDRPEFVADVIKTVDSGVKRMRRLLGQLQQGMTGSKSQRAQLHELIRSVLETLDDAGRVSLSSEGPLWVDAPRDQLVSVITHIVTNALEADKTGAQVNIRLYDRGGSAVVEVRDFGEGMSEEFVKRQLFRPFVSTKGQTGMGIGAYQARETVRSFGGDIVVESQPEAGTTVRITLPLSRSQRDVRAPSPTG